MAGKIRYTCGTIVPSSCVPYTGVKLPFLSDAEQPECDANLDEVLELFGKAVDALKKATDTSTHNTNCLSVTGDKNVKTILQAQTDKICALNASITAIQQQVAGLDISDDLITIDLGCLSSAASACQTGTNKYSLLSILTLFKSEICAIKTKLGI
jgi:hypothetical protein